MQDVGIFLTALFSSHITSAEEFFDAVVQVVFSGLG